MNARLDLRAVIFDMDGVLTDSEPLINQAAVTMFGELGHTVAPEDFLPFVGTGENRYLGGVAEKHGIALDLEAAKRRTYEIYLALVPTQLRAFPGAVELVQQCRAAGLRVAVASSADRIKIEANLRQIGLPAPWWDAVICAEDVVHKKPAPDIFLAAARQLGLAPTGCVVIEDAINGVQAAQAAGMRCVAVAHSFPAEKLHPANLIRPTIGAIALSDLGGKVGQPWGFWATTGLGLAVVAAVLLAQVLALVPLVLGLKLAGHELPFDRLDQNGLLLAVGTLASFPVGLTFCWLFARLRAGLPWQEYLALKTVTGRSVWRWLLRLLVLLVVADGLTLALDRPIVPDAMVQAYRTAGWLPLLWFSVVVLAPVVEELFFRGFVYAGWANSWLGVVPSIVAIGALWASIHTQYDAYGRAQIFVAGLLLGWARWRTGSVYVPMLLHGVMNLLATLQVTVLVELFEVAL